MVTTQPNAGDLVPGSEPDGYAYTRHMLLPKVISDTVDETPDYAIRVWLGLTTEPHHYNRKKQRHEGSTPD